MYSKSSFQSPSLLKRKRIWNNSSGSIIKRQRREGMFGLLSQSIWIEAMELKWSIGLRILSIRLITTIIVSIVLWKVHKITLILANTKCRWVSRVLMHLINRNTRITIIYNLNRLNLIYYSLNLIINSNIICNQLIFHHLLLINQWVILERRITHIPPFNKPKLNLTFHPKINWWI